MVQNGKLALCALALDKQLNNVDFPTLGNPTIPAFIIWYLFKNVQIYHLIYVTYIVIECFLLFIPAQIQADLIGSPFYAISGCTSLLVFTSTVTNLFLNSMILNFDPFFLRSIYGQKIEINTILITFQ
jgi:hypothetical protein